MKLRFYQITISKKACGILQAKKIVYLSLEVRTGKTLTALETARLYGAEKVLFLTKKKAISSIQDDYNNFGFPFQLNVTNDESMHKVEGEFDLVIHDEHHRYGSYPKPGKYTKEFKKRFGNLPMIFLSGTPTPESYSQIYHQFWVSKYNPFEEKTFYKWAKKWVDVFQVDYGYGRVNDYSKGKKEAIDFVRPCMITFTQKEAGFSTQIKENVLTVKMKPQTYELCKRLKKDLVIEGKDDNIVADTPAKLMQKLHQLYSGTIKLDSGNRMVLDYSKAEFIRDHFKGKKIAIFYKFVAELEAIKKVMDVTQDLEEFNSTNKNIALQIVSGREGTNLSKADYLVYYNIDFSSTSYWQSRDRLTTMDRKSNNVFWIFSENGIEQKIYQTVLKKKNFTTTIFKKWTTKQQ